MARKTKVEGWRGRLVAALALATLCLAGCASNPEPPIDDAGPVAHLERSAAPLPRASWYTVAARRGDTLASIAARYNVSTRRVSAANGLDPDSSVGPGQILRIPAGSAETRGAILREAVNAPARNAVFPLPLAKGGIVKVARLPPPKHAQTAALSSPRKPDTENSVEAIIDEYASALKNAAGDASARHADLAAYTPESPPDEAGLHFIWPVSGHILSPFGASPGGERNDGINIAAALGAPIHAAADGEVSYAGDGIKGYGNLVLIRHDDGYVTAYAHAQSLLVSRGDHVRKGQAIGYAGATGDVNEPQLHFEIRHGVKAVDPRPLLIAAR